MIYIVKSAKKLSKWQVGEAISFKYVEQVDFPKLTFCALIKNMTMTHKQLAQSIKGNGLDSGFIIADARDSNYYSSCIG